MIFNQIINFTIVTFLFLFPLFSLPVTPDSYEYNKMALLVATCLILILLFSLKVIKEKRFVVVHGSFTIPLFFLTTAVALSTLFQSPNLAVALTTPLSTTTIIAGLLLYVLLINSLDFKMGDTLMAVLVFASVLLSLYVISLYLGLLPKSLFTPAGTLLSAAMFLSIMVVYLIAWLILYLLKSRVIPLQSGQNSKEATPKETILETDRPIIASDYAKIRYLEEDIRNLEKVGMSEKFVSEGLLNTGESGKFVSEGLLTSEKFGIEDLRAVLFYLLALLVIGTATILTSLHLFSDQKPIILPLSFGWMVFLEILKNPTSLFLGVGPSNFLTAFSLAKPISFNMTSVWNVIFTSSSSFLLTLATETGAVAAFLYLFLLFKSLKLTVTPCLFSLVFALLLQAVLPTSMSVFILTIILLTVVCEKKVVFEIDLSRLGKSIYLSLIPSLALTGVVSYFAGRAYLAEVFFKKSLDALLNNRGREAYNFQRQAISFNPYLDRYHLAFSQINLALANALAAKRELDEEDKQRIPHLVQQAIDHARVAVILYRTNVINWDNLGGTYASLINFAQDAQDWAISSYQQKLLLDPVNPSNYLVLGGLYLRLERYPEAENHFRQAISLKPDFANAHYNSSLAFRQQKKYQEAYRELQIASTLLPTDSAGAQKVAQELKELAELLPQTEATSSAQPLENVEPQTLEEATPEALINLPSLAPTITLPQPPITP